MIFMTKMWEGAQMGGAFNTEKVKETKIIWHSAWNNKDGNNSPHGNHSLVLKQKKGPTLKQTKEMLREATESTCCGEKIPNEQF